jgi:hypothetical protein
VSDSDLKPALQRSYHVLQCFSVPFSSVAQLGAIPDVEGIDSWMSGRVITTTVPEPLTIEIDPDEPGDLLEMYQLEALIMSERLVSALIGAGVDNLQVFDARIVGPETGRVFKTHRIVNIVGTVSCADLSRSTWESPRGRPMIDVDFEGLAIDEVRAGGNLLFRLAECVSAVIVHDRVRKHLLANGLTTLTFQDPADFVG